MMDAFCLSSPGSEQYDDRLQRLGVSLVVALTSAGGLRLVSAVLARLPRLRVRGKSFAVRHP
jgi:hypothetical protein